MMMREGCVVVVVVVVQDAISRGKSLGFVLCAVFTYGTYQNLWREPRGSHKFDHAQPRVLAGSRAAASTGDPFRVKRDEEQYLGWVGFFGHGCR